MRLKWSCYRSMRGLGYGHLFSLRFALGPFLRREPKDAWR